jgi:hypothetical protein
VFLFWILLSLYIIIGGALVPTFTRHSYKKVLEYKNSKWPSLSRDNEAEAKSSAPSNGILGGLAWPICLFLYLGARSLDKELEAKKKKEHEEQEIARILKEYKDSDPVEIAFKQLEADNKRKEDEAYRIRMAELQAETDAMYADQIHALQKQVDSLPEELNQKAIAEVKKKMAAGMRLDEKGIWDYPDHPDDEYEQISNLSGEIVRSYKTISGYSNGGIVKKPVSRYHQLIDDLGILENKMKEANQMFEDGTLPLVQWKLVIRLIDEELKNIQGEIDEYRYY